MTKYQTVVPQPHGLKRAAAFQSDFLICGNDKIVVSEENRQMSQLAYLENPAISLRHDLYLGHPAFFATQLDHSDGHQLDITLKWVQNLAQAVLWIEESKMLVVPF